MASQPAIADLKSYLGIAGTGEDSLLTVILNGVIEFVNRYTGRDWGTGSAEVYYYSAEPPYVLPHDRKRLHLFDQFGLLTSVTNGDGEILVVNTHYRKFPQKQATFETGATLVYEIYILPEVDKWWTDIKQEIKVSGVKGVSGSSYPEDVFLAIVMLGAHYYRQMHSGTGGAVVSANAQGLLVTPDQVPEFVMRVLDGRRL